MTGLKVVEICAGAGGQALGLELAGFEHALAVEIDSTAAQTLAHNRQWQVAVGDAASSKVWKPRTYTGVDLFAGGVPCPPFSVAGKQNGADDERDLFSWAVATAEVLKPRAILLENVRGLSTSRFAGYRQRIANELTRMGYWSDWRLMHASDFGVPQLRPRYVLVALQLTEAQYFNWPAPLPRTRGLGPLIGDLIGMGGWSGAGQWIKANRHSIAPTIVGGSKKHGGADLGPTRSKAAWAKLGVDAHGLADEPPDALKPEGFQPRLTTEMVARIQGWLPPAHGDDPYRWEFTGKKTSRYRQIGNAFPPPMAKAIGQAIASALLHQGEVIRDPVEDARQVHDPVLLALQEATAPQTLLQLSERTNLSANQVAARIEHLKRDFEIHVEATGRVDRIRFGAFRGFLGQADHARHLAFGKKLSTIS